MKCTDCINCVPGIGGVFCISDTYDPRVWNIKKSKKEGAEKCIGFVDKNSSNDLEDQE